MSIIMLGLNAVRNSIATELAPMVVRKRVFLTVENSCEEAGIFYCKQARISSSKEGGKLIL